MSWSRYKPIFLFIIFDDTEMRHNCISAVQDNLEAFRSIFDQNAQECTENYSSGCNFTVDEKLAVYRKRSPFTVYIKSKPRWYGVSIWVYADTET
jgi:hypothetical protein